MLTEALLTLAGAGGGAVVQAAGTDAWGGLRSRVARLAGRGEPERERAELARLDRTQAALESGDGDGAEQVRAAEAAAWRARFEALLEDVDEAGREPVVAELEALIAEVGTGAAAETVHNDFRQSTFHGPVQGSGTQHNTFRS